MTSLALFVLTLILGIFFIIMGQFKITSRLFPDIHEEMRHEFGRMNKVFPFYRITGWRPYAKNYRITVGIIEVVCGGILILIPGRLKQLANVVLLFIMLGAVYTHYTLHDKFDRVAPGLIFSLLLFTRLIIYQQGKHSNSTAEIEKSCRLKKTIDNDEEDYPVKEQKVFDEKKEH